MDIYFTQEELKAMGRRVAEELYQKNLRAMEEELTVENYSLQMAKIERYKQIHRH